MNASAEDTVREQLVTDSGTMQPFLQQLPGNNSWMNIDNAPHLRTLQSVVDFLKWYYTPFVVGVGFVGNALSLWTFLGTTLRKMSSTQYLSALAVIDSLFLLTLLLVWLTNLDVNLYNTEGWCQMTLYVSYVCTFLSIWYVVAFTVERYIAVCFPIKRSNMCTTFRAKAVVCALLVFAVVLYLNQSWMAGVVMINGKGLCIPLPVFISTVKVFNRVDIVLNLFLPYSTIIILNALILKSVVTFYRRRKSMIRTTTTAKRDQTITFRPKAQIKISQALLAVSFAFLLLNSPGHIMRLRHVLKTLMDPYYRAPYSEFLLQQLFQYFFYTNFSVNFFIYFLLGKGFRRGLRMQFVGLYESALIFYRRKKYPSRNFPDHVQENDLQMAPLTPAPLVENNIANNVDGGITVVS